MATIQHTQFGETVTLEPVFGYYSNGRLAIQMFDPIEGPYAKVTVNVVDAPDLGENEVYVKDWSENEPLIAKLLLAGWLMPVGESVQAGYATAKVMRLAGPLLEAFEVANSNKGN